MAYEIENGRLGRLLNNPLYTGTTPEFWRSCDAVADRASWQIWGLPNCGKGDPMQTMRVAHGAPAAQIPKCGDGVSRNELLRLNVR